MRASLLLSLLALLATILPAAEFAEGFRLPRMDPEEIAPASAEDLATARDTFSLGASSWYHLKPLQDTKSPTTEVLFSNRADGFDEPRHQAALQMVGRLPMKNPQVFKRGDDWLVQEGNDASHAFRLRWIPPTPTIVSKEHAETIRVALYVDDGSFGAGVSRIEEQLGPQKNVALRRVTAKQIRQGALAQADVVIFSGGSGSRQANALGLAGRVQVREFVRQGGGYLGICAGNYLACEGFDWGLGLLNARTKSSRWKRGVGNVQIERTPAGQNELPSLPEKSSIRYANGPIFTDAQKPTLPPFTTLAWLRSELAKNDTPVGIMTGSPAIASAAFGRGRVICSSAHPEQTPGLEHFVEDAMRWLAQPSPRTP